jgi:hypothetical protein
VSAVAANWQTLDLSTIPANSVTAAQTGADVAFIEIDNLSAASGVGLKLYNVGGNPGIDGNTLKIPAGASYTLSKVTGIKYVSLKGQTGNASVEVRVHSHQTVTHSPWPA